MAIAFSGSGQRLRLSSPLTTVYPMSMAAWVNIASLAATSGIMYVGAESGNTGFQLYITPAGKIVADPDAINFAITTATITTNTWHHVAAVFANSSNRSVYLDGGNKVTNAVAATAMVTPVASRIASMFQSVDFDLNGSIELASFWTGVALSDAEVAALAGGTNARKIEPTFLAAYLPLKDINTLVDYKANAWTKVGSPTSASGGAKIERMYGGRIGKG